MKKRSYQIWSGSPLYNDWLKEEQVLKELILWYVDIFWCSPILLGIFNHVFLLGELCPKTVNFGLDNWLWIKEKARGQMIILYGFCCCCCWLFSFFVVVVVCFCYKTGSLVWQEYITNNATARNNCCPCKL